MKIDAILDVIKKMALSQGFYGRLYDGLMEAKQYDPDSYADAVDVLEAQNFSDPVDLILFLES